MKAPLTILVFLITINLLKGQSSAVEVKHNGEIPIEELAMLNSDFRETNLSITPDGKYLYFMSSRGQMPWSVEGYTIYKGTPRYDGDIWFSKNDNGLWSDPKCLPGTVNTASGEDEPNVSPDGNFVLFQSWRDSWFSDGGPYYISELFGTAWGKPSGMKGGINQFFKRSYNKYYGYATDGAALSPDAMTFMVAAAPEYTDSMDIYMSRKNENGIWGYLDSVEINTPGDERSLFIAGDNQTIYFASDGYGGLGGLDILKTTLDENGNWGPIINIGAPFNSAKDDYNFIVTADGSMAYFVREGNIYQADISKASPRIKPLPTMLINGVVYNMYGLPVESSIELSYEDGQIKAQTKSNSETGEYAFSIYRRPGTYTERFYWNDLTKEETFQVDSGTASLKLRHETEIRDPAMMFIQFDFDKSEIQNVYKTLLDSLVQVLYSNRQLRMYIGGHTDEKGDDVYNVELSRKRVQAVGDYLSDHGIPEKIMKLDFYGESIPRVKHGFHKDEINRRVEIRIIDLRKENSG